MKVVNIHEAKTQLSKLLEAIESGAESEIVIARNGKPVARLAPLAPPSGGVVFGVAEDWGPPYDPDLAEDKRLNEAIADLFEHGDLLPEDRGS